MSDYKRLTNNNLEEYDPEYDFCMGCEHYGKYCSCNRPNGTCANYERFIETYNRLAELEDKIENSTLKEFPKKCYQVIYLLGWEILEYDIVKIKYDHMEGIVSVDATRPHTIEYFTKDNRYKGRVLGVDVFFTKPEAEAKLKELKGE